MQRCFLQMSCVAQGHGARTGAEIQPQACLRSDEGVVGRNSALPGPPSAHAPYAPQDHQAGVCFYAGTVEMKDHRLDPGQHASN